MRYKRITAAILDILLFLIIYLSVARIIPVSQNAMKLSGQLYEVTESNVLSLKGVNRNQAMELIYQLDRETSYIYIVFALILIIYFAIIPMWLKGKTLGQYIRKVKLVGENDEKVTLNKYIICALLNSGLFLVIFMPLFVYISNAIWYSRVASILCLLQVIYWIVSLIMLIVKKKTIHDYVTKTKIIEVKR